ncbi:MAG TPA: hypothetical protein DCO86_01920 [Spirochaetaceae bacterium]|nr:hypothetical protein [Spirochaetaceae bacterium]
MKKVLLIIGIFAIFLASSVASAEWWLMQQPVGDEFGDRISVNHYYLHGEDNGRFTDKFVWIYTSWNI